MIILKELYRLGASWWVCRIYTLIVTSWQVSSLVFVCVWLCLFAIYVMTVCGFTSSDDTIRTDPPTWSVWVECVGAVASHHHSLSLLWVVTESAWRAECSSKRVCCRPLLHLCSSVSCFWSLACCCLGIIPLCHRDVLFTLRSLYFPVSLSLLYFLSLSHSATHHIIIETCTISSLLRTSVSPYTYEYASLPPFCGCASTLTNRDNIMYLFSHHF